MRCKENSKNKVDGLELLSEIADSSVAAVFFDPVFRCPSGCTLHDSRYILHGEIPELYKFTRWKRKNREARLRHAISALAKLLEQTNENFATVAECFYSLRDVHEANTSCQGQDIEGS